MTVQPAAQDRIVQGIFPVCPVPDQRLLPLRGRERVMQDLQQSEGRR